MPNVNKTPFQQVAEMNIAFGNPKGNSNDIDWDKVKSQCKNIMDEWLELMEALGVEKAKVSAVQDFVKQQIEFKNEPDVDAVRDALCDIQVFSNGAQHIMGYDGDNDMQDVIDGVLTRFIKSPEDNEKTYNMHFAKGVTQVYYEGAYPYLVMKSSVDQPDAPRGKFLKSASFKQPVFRCAPQ